MKIQTGLRASEKSKALAMCAFCIGSLVLTAALNGTLGGIGTDGDDVMRFVQVRDLLNGQNWFDLTQPRLGPEGGTQMHWSRLVDLPIAVLAAVFDIFLPRDQALLLAANVWPPLSLLIAFAGLWIGAAHFGGKGARLAAFAVASIIFLGHFRFLPGAIDHHNLQLGMLALATGLLLDPHRGPRGAFAAGVIVALSVAIGVEVYGFAGVLCAFVAIDWFIVGEPAKAGARAFGVGLAAGLAVAFASTVPPESYGITSCDALSSVTLLAGAVGGFGLALCASTLSARGRIVRGLGLVMTGIACGTILLTTAPQCLGDPLRSLPPIVTDLWLNQVAEARPLFAPSPTGLQDIPFRIGVTVLALVLCAMNVRKGRDVRASLLLMALLVMALALTFHQARFYAFGHLFAILSFGAWIARVYREGKAANPASVSYLGALAVSVPALWGMPGYLLQPSGSIGANVEMGCLVPGAFLPLDRLASGRILSSADFTPYILKETRHSALHGNYHRNVTGIEQSLNIFLTPPDEAQVLLVSAGVDYVLICPADPEIRVLSAESPEGLAAELAAGSVPAYLQEQTLDGLPAAGLRVWRVDRK